MQVVTGLSNIKHLFLPISIFIYNKNNDKYRHTTSKITKEPKWKSRLGTTGKKITWGLELVCGRTTLSLVYALVHQTKQLRTTKTKRTKYKQKAKRTAGVEGQVATMQKSDTRQIDTAAMKRARKKMKKKKRTTKRRQNRSAAVGRPAMKSLGGGTSACFRPTNPRP